MMKFTRVIFSLGKSLELDSKKMKFSNYKTGREQLVQSGNLDSLLQRLTTVGYSGMAFINTFLATFPLYTDSHTIMDFLIHSWQQCVIPQMAHARSAYTFSNSTILCCLLCPFYIFSISIKRTN